MEEAEWLASDDARPMLEHLRSKASDSKLRLWGCACCRSVWHLLPGEWSRHAVEVAERYVDGMATSADLDLAWQKAAPAIPLRRGAAMYGVTDAARVCALPSISAHVGRWKEFDEVLNPRSQAALLRDVFANPFRPVLLDPAWLTADVVQLARAASNERLRSSGELDAQRLQVLADALEDAGCTNGDVLGHLRAPGMHVPGCFVVDVLTRRK